MIYFIQDTGTQAIKIGFSATPQKRLADLQTANPHQLVILGTIPGTLAVEVQMHIRFGEYRLQGEWFRGEIIETVLGIIASHKTKVREATMKDNGSITEQTKEPAADAKGDDSAIQGASQLPGLKMRSLTMELREDQKSENGITCHAELKYVLEFEEDVKAAELAQLRNLFTSSGGLRHTFLDEDGVVIPFNMLLQCWVPGGAQSPISGMQGTAFRVLASGSQWCTFKNNRSSSEVPYEGEHPLKKARKVIVHNRG